MLKSIFGRKEDEEKDCHDQDRQIAIGQQPVEAPRLSRDLITFVMSRQSGKDVLRFFRMMVVGIAHGCPFRKTATG